MIAQSWELGSSPRPRANDNTVVQTSASTQGPTHLFYVCVWWGLPVRCRFDTCQCYHLLSLVDGYD